MTDTHRKLYPDQKRFAKCSKENLRNPPSVHNANERCVSGSAAGALGRHHVFSAHLGFQQQLRGTGPTFAERLPRDFPHFAPGLASTMPWELVWLLQVQLRSAKGLKPLRQPLQECHGTFTSFSVFRVNNCEKPRTTQEPQQT